VALPLVQIDVWFCCAGIQDAQMEKDDQFEQDDQGSSLVF
jgi:hypothetical protein